MSPDNCVCPSVRRIRFAIYGVVPLFVVAVACGVPTSLWACLWDYDTLKQERSRFPSALELITGKFLRHSPEFYEWRIKNRLERLKSDPTNLGFHDDLAVAYQKTGQPAMAIEVMEAKEKIKPGEYETYSNLGTFYILAGDFEKGLPLIDKALAIKPDAHFGREKYQKWLVEYALLRRKDGKITFPLRGVESKKAGAEPANFRQFLEQRLAQKSLSVNETKTAVRGILGMMRFANHDNPLLLEALGDLLVDKYDAKDGKQLAARCYLKASYVSSDKDVAKIYRDYAQKALQMQVEDRESHTPLALEKLEAQFKTELAEADKWYVKLRDKELGWIKQGKDADAEFDSLYKADPQAETSPPFRPAGKNRMASIAALSIAIVSLSGAVVSAGVSRWQATGLPTQPTRSSTDP